jgi:hypothetical protein
LKKYFFENVFLGAKLLYLCQTPYEKDGLIFVPAKEPYPKTRKWPSLLKWKPEHLNTIDLYSVKEGNDWLLYTHAPAPAQPKNTPKKQVSNVLFDAILESNPKVQTFKAQFDDLDPSTGMLVPYQTNTVIEYAWNFDVAQFRPIRTRHDKTIAGHGNFINVAMDIWDSIHNPVTFDCLVRLTKMSNVKYYNGMRYAHNRIKEELYKNYTFPGASLLELCSGKGGDLNKWKKARLSRVDGYDIDQKSVQEAVARSNGDKNKCFRVLDLGIPDANSIVKSNAPCNGYDVSACQFAIHYFLRSKETFDNFIKILDENLKVGGYFITTFMDKAKVKQLLSGSSTLAESNREILYYINTCEYNSGLFGNELEIYLNGNNVLGSISKEYMVDTCLLKEYMESRGYITVQESDFTADGLTDYESNISLLNKAVVFQKKSINENILVVPRKDVMYTIPELQEPVKVESVEDVAKYYNTVFDNGPSYELPDALENVNFPGISLENKVYISEETRHDNWYVSHDVENVENVEKVNGMTVKELKKALKENNASTTGCKSQLVQRLLECIKK